MYDDFIFSFPSVRLGEDSWTFYYHTTGRAVPVAIREHDFLGIEEIHLLPNAVLFIEKPHGYLSLVLQVQEVSHPELVEGSVPPH